LTRHTRFVTSSFAVLALSIATLGPSEVFAGQGRAVRRSPGQSTGTAVPRSSRPYPSHPIYGGGGYYRPYYRSYYRPYYSSFYYPYYYGGFYSPFYFSFGYGWGYPYYGGAYGYGYPYYGGAYGYGYGYPPYYGPVVYDNTGSARLQVTPRNTQVYVDGYFAGVVDEFDGYLQRLNVGIGEHELQLYLDGHRPFTQKVLFTRGGTVKLIHAMEPLGPGEAPATPPKPIEPPRRSNRSPYGQDQGSMPYERQGPPPRSGQQLDLPYERQGPPPRGGQQSDFGSLLLRVRPGDADVLVDGEVWNAPAGQDQLVIELADGPHRIEVRKSGFQTYSTTVRVRRGETVRLNVSLTTGGVSGE
jgi:hypothetical protein